MNKATYLMLENFMLECMADSAHDKEHVYRVLNHALVIAEDEKDVDLDVLIAACLLHDIARPEQIRDPSLCHAEVGSLKAFGFLRENGFSETFCEHVRDCIRTHRFRKNDPPKTLEGKILFDADKLDVVGAIGVARTLVYKGTVSDPLYTRREDGTISDGTNDTESSFFREYKFKLEKLYDRFYTKKGAILAEGRKEAAKNFYNNLFCEVNLFDVAGKNLLDAYISE